MRHLLKNVVYYYHMLAKLNKYREIHFIGFDTLGAVFVSAILFLIVRISSLQSLLEDALLHNNNFGDIYLALAGIFAGLLGFIIASGAIIFTIDDGPRINLLKRNPYYNQVLFVYISASKYLMLATLLCLVLFIFANDSKHSIYLYLIIFLLLLIGTKVWRCINILKRIFLLSTKSNIGIIEKQKTP